MPDNQQVIVIGTGLGGLLTGAFLASHGYSVTFLEQLTIPGGRFTQLDYQGFAVPTGAFHAFPGGDHGPLAQCLRQLGISIDLTIPDPSFIVDIDGTYFPLNIRQEQHQHSGLRSKLGLQKAPLLWALFSTELTRLTGGDLTVTQFLQRAGGNTLATKVLDHFTKFSLGVPVGQASAIDISRSLSAQHAGKEGFLTHGNKALIDALVTFAQAQGAHFSFGVTVQKILFEGNIARGVVTDAGDFPADIIISNTGMHRSLALLADHAPVKLLSHAANATPAWGITHAIRSQRPLHQHASIILPISLSTIAGIAPISEICPSLCPAGWSYSLAYQALDPATDLEVQLQQAQQELRDYLGNDIDIFNTALYRGKHPAAAMAQMVGQHGTARFPRHITSLPNIYFAGHDVAGYGIAAEVIGDSSRQLWKMISR